MLFIYWLYESIDLFFFLLFMIDNDFNFYFNGNCIYFIYLFDYFEVSCSKYCSCSCFISRCFCSRTWDMILCNSEDDDDIDEDKDDDDDDDDSEDSFSKRVGAFSINWSCNWWI